MSKKLTELVLYFVNDIMFCNILSKHLEVETFFQILIEICLDLK